MVGKTLSHYKVIEKIGQGGMSSVARPHLVLKDVSRKSRDKVSN